MKIQSLLESLVNIEEKVSKVDTMFPKTDNVIEDR